MERISAYEKIGWSTQKTDYVYDGRGSVAQTLTYNSSWYTFGGFLSNKGVNSYTYTPFGELLTGEGSGFRFNGEYYDSATGMLNLRARQYEPGVMRFEQRDIWHGAQILTNTQNRYLYCIDDPINLYDYSGKVITGKNAGVRLPISKPLVDLTKENPALKNSLSDSIARLAELTSTGIDTTGYNDAQRKVVEEAEKKLFEEATNGTLTEEKRKSIIHAACYESFWAGGEDYFTGNWWQDKTKRAEAYQMLLLEAQSKGSLNLIAIDQEKTSDEINNKMLGFQAIANAARTGGWDEGTLSAIENGLVASGIAGSYKVTPEELAILSGREIIGRETGYWLESSGYPEMLNNAALLLLLFDISIDNNLGRKSGQNTEASVKNANGEAYADLLDAAKKADVSTSQNSAVFYSGPGNRALAEEFAELNGKTTLEMTSGGKYFDALKLFESGSPITKDQARVVWKLLSERYAQSATGNVYGFVNGSTPNSIFNTVEYPALSDNSAITNIFTELFN